MTLWAVFLWTLKWGLIWGAGLIALSVVWGIIYWSGKAMAAWMNKCAGKESQSDLDENGGE